ncbi:MAG: exopolyphosphatase [Desulfovibrio sp.]|jgi:nanoRNase/pAp phosphatase (c-di-AMP/oligoRNAs hydrolase)|nr:exopolyphosphatase [Desulfovibrio sp.]
MPRKFRLVTRSDFDGLVCAVLLKELDMLESIKFVHPKDMQDGKIEISENDITTNLPYAGAAHLVFDHHLSETVRNAGARPDNHIIDPKAPSAARVVYEYYGGAGIFPKVPPELMLAVDQADSAGYSKEDILHPDRWTLLNYVMDPRTGLGRFRQFRISNYDLMMQLIDACRTHSIEQILELPDVKERVDLYFEQQPKAIGQIRRCAAVHGKLVVLDLRNEDPIWCTNRFMIYALFPRCSISMHVLWGLKQQNTVFAAGRSILDRSDPVDIGEVMLAYGGGGHPAAGTCQVSNEQAGKTLAELTARLSA